MPTASTPRLRLAPDERRRQILDCARRLFSESHYTAVSMDAVAQAAGITRSLLNHYFGSKRELYVEVVREMFRGGEPPVPEFVHGVSPEERLAESVDRWLEFVWRNRATWLSALDAGLGGDPEIAAILERVRESAVDNVIAVLGIGPAAIARPEVRGVIRAFGGLAEAATREWLQRNRFDREQMHALLTSSLLSLVNQSLPQLLPPARVARPT